MDFHSLTAFNQTIKVSKIGSSLIEYKYKEINITKSSVEEIFGSNGKIMSPWPNRIEDGKYEFEGNKYQLQINDTKANNAIHGLSYDKEWDLDVLDENKIRLKIVLDSDCGYPGKLEQLLTYRLSESGLFVKFIVRNIGDKNAPFGFGWHPYLDAAGSVNNCKLLLDASTHIVPNERLLPVGKEDVVSPKKYNNVREIGDTVLDDAFVDVKRGFNGKTKVLFTRADDRVVEIWADANFNAWQIFSGDTIPQINRTALAIEPLTCLANAYNTKDYLQILKPGDEKILKFGIFPH